MKHETGVNMKVDRKVIDLAKVDFFGGCNVCGGWDGFLNVGEAEFGVCLKHKKKWLVGTSLFAIMFSETEDWDQNAKLLDECKAINPLINPKYMVRRPLQPYGKK